MSGITSAIAIQALNDAPEAWRLKTEERIRDRVDRLCKDNNYRFTADLLVGFGMACALDQVDAIVAVFNKAEEMKKLIEAQSREE